MEKVENKESSSWMKAKVQECLKILNSVSVEPAAMCMMTSNLMAYLLFQNMFIENICRVGRNHSAEDCRQIVNANSSFAGEETEIQKIFAGHKTYRVLLDFTFPILFVIFVGPWSDHYGRKGPLLVSTMGTALYAGACLFCSFHVSSMEPLWINIISAIPRMLTGGEVAFAMSAYSYISDQTDHKYRTVRTGMLNAGYQLGIPLGFSLVKMVTIYGLDYSTSFAISAVISLLAVVIVLLTVKNETKADRDVQKEGENLQEKVCRESPSFWSIINPKNNFLKVVALPFKRRGGNNNVRMMILLLIIVFIFSAAPIHGEFQLFYLFVRERLGWDVVKFGSFSSYNWVIAVTGVALSMGILSKWLQLRDPVVGFIAGMSQMGGCLIYLIATNGPMMYLASAVDMMNGTMIVISRSMLSKLVHRDEIGKLFSLIAVLESFIPLGIIPVYTTVYRLTVQTFSGSFIILSAVLTIPPQIIYMWFICKQKEADDAKKVDSENADELRKIVPHPVPMGQKVGESRA